MTKSWLKFKCPCCGYEPKRNMTLQCMQALNKLDTATQAIIDEVITRIDDIIYKKRMKTSYREQFIIGIHKCDNDTIYRKIIWFLEQKMYADGKDLPYLTAIIKNADNVRKKKIEHEDKRLGSNPPEIKGE